MVWAPTRGDNDTCVETTWSSTMTHSLAGNSVVPTAIMGTIRNRKNANVDIRVAAVVGGFGALSAVVGGTISDRMSDQVSNIMFALLLVFVAITQLLSLRSKPAVAQPEPALPAND